MSWSDDDEVESLIYTSSSSEEEEEEMEEENKEQEQEDDEKNIKPGTELAEERGEGQQGVKLRDEESKVELENKEAEDGRKADQLEKIKQMEKEEDEETIEAEETVTAALISSLLNGYSFSHISTTVEAVILCTCLIICVVPFRNLGKTEVIK